MYNFLTITSRVHASVRQSNSKFSTDEEGTLLYNIVLVNQWVCEGDAVSTLKFINAIAPAIVLQVTEAGLVGTSTATATLVHLRAA